MDGFPWTKEDLEAHYKAEHRHIRLRKLLLIEDFVPVYPLCEICNGEFNSFRELNAHVLFHELRHKCSECSDAFHTYVDLTQHQFEHKQRADCAICKEQILIPAWTRQHYSKHGDCFNPHKCKACSLRFFNVQSYRSHWKKVHLEPTLPRKKYQCEKCAQFYHSLNYLKYHMSTVHKNAEYETLECPTCNKLVKGKLALRRHIRRTHEAVLQICPICGITISTQRMNMHMLTHGEKTIPCPYCQKLFKSRKQLLEHERIHNGKKPYPCKYCGKGFSQAGSRRIHERIHTNERPYVCGICGKGYASGGILNVHKKKCFPK